MVAHRFQKRDCRRLSSFRNIRISFPVLKLRHNCASETCIHSLGDCQCSGGPVLEWQESFQNVSIAACLGGARDIEHITWLKRGSSIVNLLRDDFARGLKVNFNSTYCNTGCGIVGQTWSANEVDFTDAREHDFQRTRPVRNIFTRAVPPPKVQLSRSLKEEFA